MRPPLLFPLFANNTELAGIGPRLGTLIGRLCGPRIVDLLWHLPINVTDRRLKRSIADAQPGDVATLKVRVDGHIPSPNRRRPYTIRCMDETGMLHLVYFNVKAEYLQKQLPVGETRIVSGKIEIFNDQRQMAHPDFTVPEDELDQVTGFQPVFGLTAGVTPRVMKKAVDGALGKAPDLTGQNDEGEWIDAEFKRRQGFPSWKQALVAAHAPQGFSDTLPNTNARRRLAYDELLANQLALAIVRATRRKAAGRSFVATQVLWNQILRSLPFTPTSAQTMALAEIAADMREETRMLRLLQGDVGSGKTLVGLGAMTIALESGAQAALMAPTELLARQHYRTLVELTENTEISVQLLTGRIKGKERSQILQDLASGKVDILVGTHALIQDEVRFRDLGLAIIDEQHRFGVDQRVKLLDKGRAVDLLVMTATPIPRTLLMTTYGDLDVSRLTEKPANRQEIDTRVLPLDRMEDVIAGVRRAVENKAKVYWICPLVEDSELSDLSAAEDRHRHLESVFGPRVGLAHGRMKGDERDRVMLAFAGRTDGEEGLFNEEPPPALDILVATTVVEVGVDVPDATVIIIEHAERFGLAQLHQLRGRVGRGDQKSTCLLLYGAPLSENGRARLNILRQSNDGFLIAEEDLRLRGGGEVLGTKQSGLPALKIARLDEQQDLLETARKDSALILERDPKLDSQRGSALKTLLYLFERDAAVRTLKSG